MDRFVIEGGRPLQGELQVSGSKNATLPLMAAALLGDSPTVLRNVPGLRDVETMAEVLRSLGVRVDLSDGVAVIDPAGFDITEAPYDIVRKMRASIYVMGPMLARHRQAKVSMPGGCAIGARPIDLHLKGFEALGASIQLDHGNVVATADHLVGSEMNLSGAAGSSVGATCNVLMAAALAEGRTVIHGAAREPEVQELVRFLRAMGAQIATTDGTTLTVEGVRSLQGTAHSVVCDRIEAGTFLVAGAITRGNLLVKGAPLEQMEQTVAKLREIGVDVESENGALRVVAETCGFHATHIQTQVYPGFATDMQAQFMALLATVPGTSIIRETIYVDRFIHVAELNRMGANITLVSGVATVQGVERLSGAPVMASDLRASAALVLAALAAEGTTVISRVYHIDRGYEAIEKKLQAVGGRVERIQGEITEPSLPVVG